MIVKGNTKKKKLFPSFNFNNENKYDALLVQELVVCTDRGDFPNCPVTLD